jgi:hypothetical protein
MRDSRTERVGFVRREYMYPGIESSVVRYIRKKKQLQLTGSVEVE